MEERLDGRYNAGPAGDFPGFREGFAELFVRFKHFENLSCELLRIDFEVHFIVVVFEAFCVDVRAAGEDDFSIEDDPFFVEGDAAHVKFEDIDIGFGPSFEDGLSKITGKFGKEKVGGGAAAIVFVADDGDLDVPIGGVDQSIQNSRCRTEIGMIDDDGVLGLIDLGYDFVVEGVGCLLGAAAIKGGMK